MISARDMGAVRELGRALGELQRLTGRDEAEVLTTAGKGVGRKAVDYTPTPKQVAAGTGGKRYHEGVIERYFDRAAWGLHAADMKMPALKAAVKARDIQRTQAILANTKGGGNIRVFEWDPDVVYSQMNQRGQIPKTRKGRAVFADGPREAALKEARRRVGKAKGGWGAGLIDLGASVAAWIGRYSGEGSYIDKRNAVDPSFEFINSSRWAERSDEANRIRGAAVRGYLGGMLKQIAVLQERRLREIKRRIA